MDKVKVLVMAPTACAATIIQGKTIESALGMIPQSRWNYVPVAQEKQAKFIFLYEDLKVVFIDEISMLGKDVIFS